MKLIQQKTLYFSEGKSDKVYEVDLCESQELFVVNFRYGRRGANLREGTKTVFPVGYEEALKIFNKLVESKEKKGYSEEIGKTSSVQASTNTVQKETILKYLKQALEGVYARNWKVSKIIARTAVLDIEEAIPLVEKFITSEDTFEQYNAIAVLNYFKVSEHVTEILNVFKTQEFNTIVGRIACAYVLKYGDVSAKEEVFKVVQKYITQKEIDHLPMQFLGDNSKDPMLLYYAYVYSFKEEKLRKQVHAILEEVPLKVNTFMSARYIYRSALILDDALFFGVLSKRTAVSNPGYTSEYFYVGEKWIDVDEEKRKPNPSIAFSGKTKQYFIKNSYKKLYELSIHDKETYIQFAKELLCALDDEKDRVSERVEYSYDYNLEKRRYVTVKRYYPAYYQFLGLMYVLYGNSNRFSNEHVIWFSEEERNATQREEILKELWSAKPEEVLYVLANAKSKIATNFSLNIIKEHPDMLEAISNENLLKLLKHSQESVINLITEYLENKYKENQPETSILISLLSSKNPNAIELGLRWLVQYEANYFSENTFFISLLLSDEVKVIDYLAKLYHTQIPYKATISVTNLERLFEVPSKFNKDFLVAVSEFVGNTKFGELITDVSQEKIAQLASSKATTNKLFAINLAKHAKTPVYELFKDSYNGYISSDETVLRKAGIELLAHFPDQFLLENKKDIVVYCFSEYEAVRKAIQPTIHKLVNIDRGFKQSLLKQLLVQLTEAETYEGVHENCYELLTALYGSDLSALSKEEILELILSKYEFAQRLGTPLFEKRVPMSTLSVKDLVRLSQSDVFSIRKALQSYFESNTARINYELETALQIFNSNWQDVIDWGCVYFEKHIDAKNWTVDMLVYVCDHVKEQVQAFGRSMITKHFSDEKGLPLLLKLQEHPTQNMQFFVTNYLEKYASDNIPVILKLETYFKTTLFYINTKRATKTRVYAFLEKESAKSKEIALMTVRILSSILGSKIMTDRDRVLDILLLIAETHEEIEIPLLIKEI